MGHRTVGPSTRSVHDRPGRPASRSERGGRAPAPRCTDASTTSCSATGSGSPAARDVSDCSPWFDVEHGLAVVNYAPEQAGSDRGRSVRSARPSWSYGRQPAAPGRASPCRRPYRVRGESRFFYSVRKRGCRCRSLSAGLRRQRPARLPVVDLAWPRRTSSSSLTARFKYRGAGPGRARTVVDVVHREKRREELVFRITDDGAASLLGGSSTSRRTPRPRAPLFRQAGRANYGRAPTFSGSFALLHRHFWP